VEEIINGHSYFIPLAFNSLFSPNSGQIKNNKDKYDY
ncbi:unnamed protein product, partial [marine sediment metagenome]